jgi:all-trans-retinol dehydrogenase (NAD+)
LVVNFSIASKQTTRAFLDGMIERKYGRIVGISGIVAKFTQPMGTVYNTLKIAIRGFMNTLYEEIFALHLEDYIKTTTAFPFYMNTRQELMDLLGNTSPPPFPILSPEEAADKIIKGMLQCLQYLTTLLGFLSENGR